MFVRQLQGVRDQLHLVTSGLDPAVMHGRDAAVALGVCAEIERLAAGARTLLAARVEQTRAWTGTGSTSAAHWLAEQAGTSVGEAAGMLRTGKHLTEQPEIRQAVRDGALSPKQAELVSQGAAADPAATGTLLDLAAKASLGELREQSQRTIAAAEADEMAAYRRVRRTRYWRHRRDADGAWVGTIRTTPDCGALLMAGINAARPAIFDAARRCGHWDPSEAYDADALVALAAAFLGTPVPPPDRPDPSTGDDQAILDHDAEPSSSAAAGRSASASRRLRSAGSRTPLVARVDHAALTRGRTRPGERCEITGIGPVPVKIIRELLGGAFIAAVAVDEHGEPTRVTHLGRRSKAARAAARQHAPPRNDALETATPAADTRGTTS